MPPFHNADRVGTGSFKWDRYPADVLPLWVADMDFPCAPAIVAALHKRVGHGVFGYSVPPPGLLDTCIAYFARRWDWQVEPDWIVLSPGLGVSIHTVARHLGNRALGLLTPQPIYHVFRHASGPAQRRRIDVPFTRDGEGWTLDPDALAAAARGAVGAGVLMLCNPHNPNGKVFTRPELEALAEAALRHDWIICADEVHADLILDEDKRHVPLATLGPEVAARTVTMQSPSKAFNIAGLNFAVVVIPDPHLRAAYRAGANGQVLNHLNPLGLVAAQAAWGGECDGWLADCVTHLRGNRDRLATAVAGLDGIEMPHLAATYLAWLDVRGLGLDNPTAHFESHGLGMSPGPDFGGPGWMRLNFGCDATTLATAIDRLAAATKVS